MKKVRILILLIGIVAILVSCDPKNNENLQDQPSNQGKIGEWETTSSLITPRHAHSTVIHNNFIYVIGGSNQNDLNDIEYAVINSDGSLGSWRKISTFSTGRSNHTNFIFNNTLFLIGCWEDKIEYAEILADSTLGEWRPTTALPQGRLSHTTIFKNNRIYVMGGFTDRIQTPRNDVIFTPIKQDMSFGNWKTTSSIQGSRHDHSSVEHNGYIYIIGGNNETTDYLSDVQFSKINPDGTLGNWVSTTSLPDGRTGHDNFIHNGYIFVAGGYDNKVVYAEILADGHLGEWEENPTSFDGTRGNHTFVVHYNYAYIIGGHNSGTDLGDVQYAKMID